jgi:hypothetical protein
LRAPATSPSLDGSGSAEGRAEQVTLEATGQVPAVIERKAHLRPLSRPDSQLEVSVAGRPERLLRDPPPELVERDDGVAVLVRVDTGHDHGQVRHETR